MKAIVLNDIYRRYGLAWLIWYILFGLLFVQALAALLSVSWSRTMTVAFYSVAAVWGVHLVLLFSRRLRTVNFQSALFLGFVLIGSASMVFSPGHSITGSRFASYFPFMVVLPYICGSLMRQSDIKLFQQCILVMAWILLPLLILDRLELTTSAHGVRWPFFGMNHSPLLISAVIASAMMATCIHVFEQDRDQGESSSFSKIWWSLGLVLLVVAMVWVSARGWLIAGLAGCATVCITASHASVLRRVTVFLLIVFVAAVSSKVLSHIDSEFGAVYRQVAISNLDIEPWPWAVKPTPELVKPTPELVKPTPELVKPTPELVKPTPELVKPTPELVKPILGDASCEPFRKGVNSIEMRWVLYQEAIAMFLENPVNGVGATRFGYHSCTGSAGFPHSTVLQAFAELGLMGGGIYIALLSLSGIRLLRRARSSKEAEISPDHAFVMAMFVAFVLADQLYGNYFMATGSWLLLGIIGGLCGADRKGSVNAT